MAVKRIVNETVLCRKMFRKFKLKSNGLNKSMPSLVFDNDTDTTTKTADFGFQHGDNDDMSLIEGNVHLKIILPNGTNVETDVDAKTPMMDLLVQVTTSNGIVPGGLYLKVPSDRPPGYIHYKPNEPVGKLNCNLLEIVPKFDLCERPKKQMPKTANQPFEPTIRIQVDLPKNQKTFLRINPNLTLREVFTKICTETKNNSLLYELRSTKRLDSHLDLDLRLSDAGTVDFALIPCRNVNFRKSINDVYDLTNKAMPSAEDKQTAKSKGIFGCFNKKNKKQPTTDSSAGTRMSTYEVPSSKTTPTPITNGQRDSISSSIAADEKSLSSNRQKKRSAPKPPDEIAQLTNGSPTTTTTTNGVGSHGKLHHAPLSHFAVDQQNVSQTPKQRIRQNSDSSSGYHDGGSSLNSPSPEAGFSERTTAGDSVVDTALSEKSTSSGDASLSGSTTVRPTSSATPPAQKSVTAVRSSRAVSDTSETSAGSTKKKNRAPPPPSSSPTIVTEKIERVFSSPETIDHKDNSNLNIQTIRLRNDGVSTDEATKSNVISSETRRKTSTSSNLDEINGRNSSPTVNGKVTPTPTPMKEKINSIQSPDVAKSLHETSPKKPVNNFNTNYTPKKIFNDDLNVDVSSTNGDVAAVNDGRKSWLHCSPTSAGHTIDLNQQDPFVESIGPSPPPEEIVKPTMYVEPQPEPRPPAMYSQASPAKTPTPPQISPRYNKIHQLNDPKRESYPSTMAVKSFEDEYYEKKANNDLHRVAENEEFVANRRTSGDDAKRRSTAVAVSSTAKQEAKLFSVYSDKIENPTLHKEYEKLQILFTEWQNRLNRNEAIIKNGEKLSSEEIIDFQKMQSIMMEQHKLVQKLCAESENQALSSSKMEKNGFASNERQTTAVSSSKISPTSAAKTNERRTPTNNYQHQKQIQVDDRHRNSTGVVRNWTSNANGRDESAVDTSSLIRPSALKSTNNGNFVAADQRPTTFAYRAEPFVVASVSKPIKSSQSEPKFGKSIVIPTMISDASVNVSGEKLVVVDTSMPQLWTPTTVKVPESTFRNGSPYLSPVSTTTTPAFNKQMVNGNGRISERTTTPKRENFVEKSTPSSFVQEKSSVTTTPKRENFVEKSTPSSFIQEKSSIGTIERTTTPKRENFVEKSTPPSFIQEKSSVTTTPKRENFVEKSTPSSFIEEKSSVGTIERTTPPPIKEIYVEKSSPINLISAKSATIGPSVVTAPPPPPPPPVSNGPPVPPMLAEMRNIKLKSATTTDRRSAAPSMTNADPKDELMRAIRSFGGSGGLKKVTSAPSNFR